MEFDVFTRVSGSDFIESCPNDLFREVIGPSLGGIFVDLFKFPRAATLMALFSLIGVSKWNFFCAITMSDF